MSVSLNEISLAVTPCIDPKLTKNDDKSILIVDDEESVRSIFAECLHDYGYSCATAATGKEALEHLANESYALVIADMIMPGMSGIGLLCEITTHFPDTVVIMVSGVDRSQHILNAVRLGAFDYLIKPCDVDALRHCVERALERRALLRAAHHYKQDLERQNLELANRKAELERLQAQIVHSEKMASLGQLAAGVAHELNNPAGFIHGNMEILNDCAAKLERLLSFYDGAVLADDIAAQARGIKQEIRYQETLDDLSSIISDCRHGAERIRDIVQNLRLFSRLDEAEVKKVDLHEGIESTIRLLSQYYSSDRITLQRDYAEIPPIVCYAGQLNQVWMNLLVNAAQAIRGSGVVRVTTRLEDQTALITISDTGCGIRAEHLSKIFDPFFTTKPVGEGTGLGLSISYGIVERHHGFIKVESCGNEGTTFTIAIPIEGNGLKLDRSE